MIQLIFKQLWNQRKSNAWIFLEIIVAGVFLWYTVDSAFVKTAVRSIPAGYTEKGKYAITLDAYFPKHKHYDQSVTEKEHEAALRRIMDQVRNLPEVESFYLAQNSARPNGLNWSGGQFFPDTTAMNEKKYHHAQWYEVYDGDGSDFTYTLGLTDARTGEELHMAKPDPMRENCYISEHLAQEMFGDQDPIGQQLYESKEQMYTVKGVFKEVRTSFNKLPYSLVVFGEKQLPKFSISIDAMIVVRLKDGVDGDAFVARFMEKTAPTMKGANIYVSDVKSLGDLREEYGNIMNIYNKQRVQYALIVFTLLCIFLGMVGTFWIRAHARRQEIGLMRSMGASSTTIVQQFLCESWLLVTVGFLLSLLGVANLLVIGEGMAQPEGGYDAAANVNYWMFETTPHFVVVTILTYVLLLAISWIGTYIPVQRASKVLPAEALRDE